MSNPYILVNPQTPKQFAALVQFLKETGCPFEVPADQHYPTEKFSTNEDRLDTAILDTVQTGQLPVEDAVAVFGIEVEDYTKKKRVRWSTTQYKVPKDTKGFWGVEFLNKKGFITPECALKRLSSYIEQSELLLKSGDGFTTDETLRSALATEKGTIYFADLTSILEEMSSS